VLDAVPVTRKIFYQPLGCLRRTLESLLALEFFEESIGLAQFCLGGKLDRDRGRDAVGLFRRHGFNDAGTSTSIEYFGFGMY
jgi:hypothetical protein